MSVVYLSPIRGLSLFIHDPEPYYPRVMRTLLASHGARIIETGTEPSEITKRCLAIRPDILVLAMEPHVAAQGDLITAIRNGQSGIDRETRIVVATKCSRLDYIRKLAASGADAVILKPFNGKTVLAQMDRVARQRIAILRARAQRASEAKENAFGLIRSFNSR